MLFSKHLGSSNNHVETSEQISFLLIFVTARQNMHQLTSVASCCTETSVHISVRPHTCNSCCLHKNLHGDVRLLGDVQCLPISDATRRVQLVSLWGHKQCGAEQRGVRARDWYVLLQWAHVSCGYQPRLLHQLGFPQGERSCEVTGHMSWIVQFPLIRWPAEVPNSLILISVVGSQLLKSTCHFNALKSDCVYFVTCISEWCFWY
jgi:hypothetical protein